MMYKNSFKLIFSNFHLVWKLLFFFVIIVGALGYLSYIACQSIFDIIGVSSILTDLFDQFNIFIQTFDAPSFLVSVETSATAVVELIIGNIANIWHYLLLLGLIFIIVPAIVNNFYLLSTCNVLHHYMGSNVNFGFTASLFVNFWKNVRYQLVCLITIVPIKFLTYLLVIKSFALFSSPEIIIRVLSPVIITGIYVLLTSLRVAIFSGWVPYMLVKNANVLSGLVNGFKCIRKRFVRIFSASIGVILTIFIISVLGLFTFGASLIITAPAAYLFVATFNMVSFYSATGLRFYVDSNNIYAPKKTEMVENYKIYKNII